MTSTDSCQLRRVLVAEDESAIATWLETCLARNGYDVRSATSTDQTLELLESDPEWPTALVVDLNLQGKTSLPVIERAIECCPEARIVASSGFVTPEAERKLNACGVGFLQKPFSIEALLEAVESR